MTNLLRDDWQQFTLGKGFRRHLTNPSPQSFQRRCAKLVETGNLSKAFQLATSLSAPQRIALLQNKHPVRHTTSFTAREIETVTSQPAPDPVNTLPVISSDSVLHYIRKARKGVAPGFDKRHNEHVKTLSDCYNPIPSADALLYISHLTSFLNLLRSGTLPPNIIAVFRDGHLISIPKSQTDDRPNVLASIYRKWYTAIPLQSIIPDLHLVVLKRLSTPSTPSCTPILITMVSTHSTASVVPPLSSR